MLLQPLKNLMYGVPVIPTQVVFFVRTAEAFFVVAPCAIEVKLLRLFLATQEHSPSTTICLHVAPHQHRFSTRAPAGQPQVELRGQAKEYLLISYN